MNVASEKCVEDGCRQTVDEAIRYDVGCQTTIENIAKKDASCQTIELLSNNISNENFSNGKSDVEDKRKPDDELEEISIIRQSIPCCNNLNSTCDKKLDKSAKSQVTKLLILNLHPNVSDKDLSLIFQVNFKSYQFSKVNYFDNGTPLGTADIVFGERADALKAKKKFNGKKLDGQPINIVLLDQQISDFMQNLHFYEKTSL